MRRAFENEYLLLSCFSWLFNCRKTIRELIHRRDLHPPCKEIRNELRWLEQRPYWLLWFIIDRWSGNEVLCGDQKKPRCVIVAETDFPQVRCMHRELPPPRATRSIRDWKTRRDLRSPPKSPNIKLMRVRVLSPVDGNRACYNEIGLIAPRVDR